MTSVRNNNFSSSTGRLQRVLVTVGAMLFILFAGSHAYAQHSVTASWDRNTDSYTAGYRVFYGTASGNYQWSIDAGNQISVPLNLSAGRYFFTVRGYTSSYREGPPSSETMLDVGVNVAPSAAIEATLQNNTTALVRWQSTNAVSATINGTNVAVNGSATVAVAATTTFTLVVRSANGATATSSATVTLGPVIAAAPLPPTNMAANVVGSRVTLSWRPNASGGVPTQYVLYVGSTSWGNQIVNGRSVGTALSVPLDLPPGTYYARVRARNAYGISVSSSQVQFHVLALATSTTQNVAAPASVAAAPEMAVEGLTAVSAASASALDAPQGLTVGGLGSRIDLAWSPAAGAEPFGYVIEAGSAAGLADLGTVTVGNETRFSTDVPSGKYFIRVRAVSDAGPGRPSNEIVVQR